jgi:hypothetical protein
VGEPVGGVAVGEPGGWVKEARPWDGAGGPVGTEEGRVGEGEGGGRAVGAVEVRRSRAAGVGLEAAVGSVVSLESDGRRIGEWIGEAKVTVVVGCKCWGSNGLTNKEGGEGVALWWDNRGAEAAG